MDKFDLDKLVADEEKRLGVNSPEFNQRHKELMDMIDKAGGKHGHDETIYHSERSM